MSSPPVAVRLDELPAEVCAEELAPCICLVQVTCTTHSLRCTSDGCCSASADLTGVRRLRFCGPLGIRDGGSCPETSLQVRAARCANGLIQAPARAAAETKPSARRFKAALEEPYWHTLNGGAQMLLNALGQPSGVPLSTQAFKGSCALLVVCSAAYLTMQRLSFCSRQICQRVSSSVEH